MAQVKQKSIFNRIKRLFSTGGVVVRHIGGKKFKVVDTNTLQGSGNQNLSRDRFHKLFTGHTEVGSGFSTGIGASGYGTSGGTGAYGKVGYQQQNIEFQRNKIYIDYELMDKDPIISSAFDILADECLAGDTLIPLLNGTKLTLKQLHERNFENFWLYGLDNDTKSFKPVKAERVAYNGKKRVKLIKFEDGTELKATDSHQWVLPNGEIKFTKDLSIGDGVLNLPTKLSSTKNMSGYEQIWNPYKRNYEYTHRVIGNGLLLEDKNKINKEDRPVLHHESLNKLNNDPNKLKWMSWVDHNKLHAEINETIWGENGDPKIRDKYRKNQKAGVERFWKSDKATETRKRWSKLRKEMYSKMTTNQRKDLYGNPGELNGMYGNGYKLAGDRNGRYDKNLTRIDVIDDNLVKSMIKNNPHRGILNEIMNHYNLKKSQWLKYINPLMKKYNVDSHKTLINRILLETNLDLLLEFRDYCKINYNPNKRFIVKDFLNKNNIDDGYLRRIVETAGYQNYNEFANSNNHKIISISDIGEEDVYDIVNTGDNHIYALEMKDGSKLYTHNCTVKNQYGEMLIINSDNQDIKEILENLFFDVLNIEFNLNSWVRNLVKYGDFYLALDIMEDYGIVNAYPLSPYFIYRMDGQDPNAPFDVKFEYDLGDGIKDDFEQYEIAHFRLLGDTNFLPYGKSFAENGRFIFKQLYLMEEAMMIHRIMRAPEKRIFKIDVGNLSSEEVDLFMEKIVNRAKKTPIIDNDTGEYNLKYNMQNILEDFYVPVRGGNNGAEIESLGGLEYNAIEDIEYLRDKLFAALKVPKAYLSYESEIEGKATLAAEDVKFAKTIQRIQNVIISELTKIAIVHLYVQGFENADITNFSLELPNPSLIFEKERMELLNQQSDLFSSLTENKAMSRNKAFEVIFNYTPDEIEKEEAYIIEDLKRKFRHMQIEDEGNDPKVSGESYGTPHDIASMHMTNANKGGSEEGGQPGAGRPKKFGSTYGTDDSTFGRDPVGSKDMFKSLSRDKTLKHNFRKGSPISYESLEKTNLRKNKNTKLITETFETNETNFEDEFKGTFLDEKNLEN